MAFEHRSAEGHAERLPQLAMSWFEAAGRVDSWIRDTHGTGGEGATMTIPIVFTTVGDPVGAGLVSASAGPGGTSRA